MKADTNKWKYILHSWIGRPQIVKMSVVLSVLYRFNAIPIRIATIFFFAKVKEIQLRIYIESQGSPNSQNNLKKQTNKQVGSLILSNFKIYYMATIIETMWY